MSVPAYFNGGTFDGQMLELLDTEPPEELRLGVAADCSEYVGWVKTELYRLIEDRVVEDPKHSPARCGGFLRSWHYDFVEEVFGTWEAAPEPAKQAR